VGIMQGSTRAVRVRGNMTRATVRVLPTGTPERQSNSGSPPDALLRPVKRIADMVKIAAPLHKQRTSAKAPEELPGRPVASIAEEVGAPSPVQATAVLSTRRASADR